MNDLQFGTHQENALFPTICREFGEDLKKTTGWATFDYEDGRTQVELKSRTNTHRPREVGVTVGVLK